MMQCLLDRTIRMEKKKIIIIIIRKPPALSFSCINWLCIVVNVAIIVLLLYIADALE